MTDVAALHGCECESGESFGTLVRCGKPARQRMDYDGRSSWLCDECARILHLDEEDDEGRCQGCEDAPVGMTVAHDATCPRAGSE